VSLWDLIRLGLLNNFKDQEKAKADHKNSEATSSTADYPENVE